MTNEFTAWHIDDDGLALTVEESPVGRIHISSWSRRPTRIPREGCAVILPTSAAVVTWPGVGVTLNVGCYALAPGGAELLSGAGLIIHTPDYIGLPQMGGPVEDRGRLNYIDGCSDSLLVCPPRLGEPCLNLLHLPPGINQTAHTHPSERIGIILRGAGVCRTPDGEHVLAPGMFWWIPTGCVHSFHTRGESLDVFAWHPDSDFGPSHDFHPMLNRTIVGGVSANDPRHHAIRTT